MVNTNFSFKSIHFFGSHETIIIFDRLEYFFKNSKKGFWKFYEPCKKHPLYRKGDSWKEDIGLSRKVFRRAFAKIGMHHPSKYSFLKLADPFQGKPYASYYDRKTNRTFFLKNKENLTQFLKNRPDSPIVDKSVDNISESPSSPIPKRDSRNVPKGQCLNLKKIKHKINSSTHTFSPDQKNGRSRSSSPPSSRSLEKEKDIYNKMFKIWLDTVESSLSKHEKTIITPWRYRKLREALRDSFENDLTRWQAYCERIEANDFLMGGGQRGWKASFDWALKPESIQKVLKGIYTGQRETRSERASRLQNERPVQECDVQGSATWKKFAVKMSEMIGGEKFRTWFETVTPVDFEGERPRIQCKGNFQRDWIERNFFQQIDFLKNSVLNNKKLIFEVRNADDRSS